MAFGENPTVVENTEQQKEKILQQEISKGKIQDDTINLLNNDNSFTEEEKETIKNNLSNLINGKIDRKEFFKNISSEKFSNNIITKLEFDFEKAIANYENSNYSYKAKIQQLENSDNENADIFMKNMLGENLSNTNEETEINKENIFINTMEKIYQLDNIFTTEETETIEKNLNLLLSGDISREDFFKNIPSEKFYNVIDELLFDFEKATANYEKTVITS